MKQFPRNLNNINDFLCFSRVTARVINILLAAQHEDWENLLYIDPRIIRKGVVFLLRHQMADGGFQEEGSFALDSKVAFCVKFECNIEFYCFMIRSDEKMSATMPIFGFTLPSSLVRNFHYNLRFRSRNVLSNSREFMGKVCHFI